MKNIQLIYHQKKSRLVSFIFVLLCAFLFFPQPGQIQGKVKKAGIENKRKIQVRKAFRKYRGRHVIYISKDNFRLNVYNRRLKVILQFTIGYGRNPDQKSKQYEWDNRTPEGFYRIDEILSASAPRRSHSYRQLKRLNELHLKASEGFYKYGQPHVDTGKNAYGPRLFYLDYPNQNDKKWYRKALEAGKLPLIKGKPANIGSGIAIHGNNDPTSVGTLSSSGCIIMHNKDITKLSKYVRKGMPVIIRTY